MGWGRARACGGPSVRARWPLAPEGGAVNTFGQGPGPGSLHCPGLAQACWCCLLRGPASGAFFKMPITTGHLTPHPQYPTSPLRVTPLH